MWPFRKKQNQVNSTRGNSCELVFNALGPWKKRHVRTAWRPIVQAHGKAAYISQFGGNPLVRTNFPVPNCQLCDEAPALFLQLDSNELPANSQTFGEGVLQFFYCIPCEADGEGWAAFSKATQFRILPRTELILGQLPSDSVIAARTIVGWEQFQDFPTADEFEELGMNLKYDPKKEIADFECRELGVLIEKLPLTVEELSVSLTNDNEAAARDKLGGWPHWIQNPEYPNCPICSSRMALFFQIDSQDNLDFMFGDAGCGHITQCPHHPDQFAFAWACC